MKLLPRNLTKISSRLKFTQISKFQGQKGRGLGDVTYFCIMGPSLGPISLKWVKLETSNLVCGLIVRPTNQKVKVGQKGRGLRHVTHFYNFGTRSIYLELVKLVPSNLVGQMGVAQVTFDLLFFSDLSTSVERHSLRASYNL